MNSVVILFLVLKGLLKFNVYVIFSGLFIYCIKILFMKVFDVGIYYFVEELYIFYLRVLGVINDCFYLEIVCFVWL